MVKVCPECESENVVECSPVVIVYNPDTAKEIKKIENGQCWAECDDCGWTGSVVSLIDK